MLASAANKRTTGDAPGKSLATVASHLLHHIASRYIASYCVTLYCIILRHAILHPIASRYVASHSVTLCCITFCHAMLHHIQSRYVASSCVTQTSRINYNLCKDCSASVHCSFMIMELLKTGYIAKCSDIKMDAVMWDRRSLPSPTALYLLHTTATHH